MSVFDKFAKNVDIEGLKKDVQEAFEKGGNGDREPVPDGIYEACIEKMEPCVSKRDKMMLSIWFKVLEGSNKGRFMFYNQVLGEGWQYNNAMGMMKSLDTGIEISFEGITEFADLILEVSNAVSEQGLAFAVEQKTNDRG